MARELSDSKKYRTDENGFLITHDAISIVKRILNERDLKRRVRNTADFLKLVWEHKVGEHPDFEPYFDDLIEQCLRDCLEIGTFTHGLKLLLDNSFSANQEKRFLDLAVEVFIKSKKLKEALNWIESVSYVFGRKAVIHLTEKHEFKVLHTSKRFLKVTGPDAELELFNEALKDSMAMWKNDEYDNIKDALFDGRGLLKDAERLKSPLVEKAREHLLAVEKEARELMKRSPEIREYLEGLL